MQPGFPSAFRIHNGEPAFGPVVCREIGKTMTEEIAAFIFAVSLRGRVFNND